MRGTGQNNNELLAHENTVSIIDNTTDKVIGKVEVGKIPNRITFKR
ncbi:hypothetical protein [Sporomusa carbonis]